MIQMHSHFRCLICVCTRLRFSTLLVLSLLPAIIKSDLAAPMSVLLSNRQHHQGTVTYPYLGVSGCSFRSASVPSLAACFNASLGFAVAVDEKSTLLEGSAALLAGL